MDISGHGVSTFALWGVFLLLQNAAFTFVSRARNSASYMLHATAATCSNGVWIAGQFVSLAVLVDTIKTGTFGDRLFVVAFYTVCTVVGSVAMHWLSVTYIESGRRKVGAGR